MAYVERLKIIYKEFYEKLLFLQLKTLIEANQSN